MGVSSSSTTILRDLNHGIVKLEVCSTAPTDTPQEMTTPPATNGAASASKLLGRRQTPEHISKRVAANKPRIALRSARRLAVIGIVSQAPYDSTVSEHRRELGAFIDERDSGKYGRGVIETALGRVSIWGPIKRRPRKLPYSTTVLVGRLISGQSPLKGRKQTPELIENRAAGLRGKKKSAEVRALLRRAHEGRLGPPSTPEKRAKQSATMMGHPVSAEARVKIGLAGKGRRKTPEQIEACRGFGAKSRVITAQGPNKLEQRVGEVLRRAFPSAGFHYNYDGIIAKKVPDFLRSDDLPIAVDVHGDYWHRGEDVDARKRLYADAGYTLVVIWETEFNMNPNILIERVHIAEQDYSRKTGLTTFAKEA